MASKRRIRRKACAGKQRHETAAAAYANIMALRKAGFLKNQAMNAYKCGFCGWFHIGHRPRGAQ